jgi:hypothetical protein
MSANAPLIGPTATAELVARGERAKWIFCRPVDGSSFRDLRPGAAWSAVLRADDKGCR